MDARLIQETLQAIKNISISDLAELPVRRSSVVDGQKADLYPECIHEVLHKLDSCFEAIKGQLLGADDMMPLLVQAMTEDESLLDHDVISKISILIDYVGDIPQYELTSLAVAVMSVRCEKILNLDLLHLSDHDNETLNVDKKAQQVNEKEIKVQMAKVEEKMKLEVKCQSYMTHIENIVSEEIQKKPQVYEAYKLSADESVQNSSGGSSPTIRHLSNSDLLQIGRDKNIPKPIRTAIRQYNSVNDLYQTLNNPQADLDTNLRHFHGVCQLNKKLLGVQRDKRGVTFMKVAGTILSLGIATPLLWRKEERELTKKIGGFFSHTPTPKKSPHDGEAPSDEVKPKGIDL